MSRGDLVGVGCAVWRARWRHEWRWQGISPRKGACDGSRQVEGVSLAAWEAMGERVTRRGYRVWGGG